MPAVSVVIPAYNEEDSIRRVVDNVRQSLEAAAIAHEIIVVVDGATDNTEQEATGVADRLVLHPQNLGYGSCLKSGILAAKHDLIAITDADDTYPVDRLPDLIAASARFDMVVAARTGSVYEGSFFKRWGRVVFRRLSEFSVGQKIPDINSGMRVLRKHQIVPFFPIISAGFSFTTTCTLAYMHHGLCVHYQPTEYRQRTGKSKVHHFRDSLRALQIIVEAILRINPIKIFLLLAAPFGLLSALAVTVAVIRSSLLWALISVLSLAAWAVIVGLGFLAVAIKPQNPVTARSITSSASSADGSQDRED